MKLGKLRFGIIMPLVASIWTGLFAIGGSGSELPAVVDVEAPSNAMENSRRDELSSLRLDEVAVLNAASMARRFELAPSVVRGVGVNAGDLMRVSLFDDEFRLAEVEKVLANTEGVVTIRGAITESQFGFVLLSTFNGRTNGSIRVPERGLEYRIVYLPDSGTHYLIKVDPERADRLPGSPPLVPTH